MPTLDKRLASPVQPWWAQGRMHGQALPQHTLTLLTGCCSTGCCASEPARLKSAATCPAHKAATPGIGQEERGWEATISAQDEAKTAKGVIPPLPFPAPPGIRPPGFKFQSIIYQLHDFRPQFSHLTNEKTNLPHRASVKNPLR